MSHGKVSDAAPSPNRISRQRGDNEPEDALEIQPRAPGGQRNDGKSAEQNLQLSGKWFRHFRPQVSLCLSLCATFVAMIIANSILSERSSV